MHFFILFLSCSLVFSPVSSFSISKVFSPPQPFIVNESAVGTSTCGAYDTTQNPIPGQVLSTPAKDLTDWREDFVTPVKICMYTPESTTAAPIKHCGTGGAKSFMELKIFNGLAGGDAATYTKKVDFDVGTAASTLVAGTVLTTATLAFNTSHPYKCEFVFVQEILKTFVGKSLEGLKLTIAGGLLAEEGGRMVNYKVAAHVVGYYADVTRDIDILVDHPYHVIVSRSKGLKVGMVVNAGRGQFSVAPRNAPTFSSTGSYGTFWAAAVVSGVNCTTSSNVITCGSVPRKVQAIVDPYTQLQYKVEATKTGDSFCSTTAVASPKGSTASKVVTDAVELRTGGISLYGFLVCATITDKAAATPGRRLQAKTPTLCLASDKPRFEAYVSRRRDFDVPTYGTHTKTDFAMDLPFELTDMKHPRTTSICREVHVTQLSKFFESQRVDSARAIAAVYLNGKAGASAADLLNIELKVLASVHAGILNSEFDVVSNHPYHAVMTYGASASGHVDDMTKATFGRIYEMMIQDGNLGPKVGSSPNLLKKMFVSAWNCTATCPTKVKITSGAIQRDDSAKSGGGAGDGSTGGGSTGSGGVKKSSAISMSVGALVVLAVAGLFASV